MCINDLKKIATDNKMGKHQDQKENNFKVFVLFNIGLVFQCAYYILQ